MAFMKIFVEELKTSFPVEFDIFENLSIWMPFLNKMLTPIMDRKVQLALDATHTLNSKAQYESFFKYMAVGQLLLGAMLVVVDRAYRVHHLDSEVSSLESSKMLCTDELKDFVQNGDFDRLVSGVDQITHIEHEDDAYAQLIKMAKEYSELILNKGLYGNIVKILNTGMKESFFSKISNKISDQNDAFLKIKIADENFDVLLHFKETQDQLDLIDQWLAIPELSLPVDGKVFQIKSVDAFLSWFNLFRMIVESELCYQTLLQYIETYPESEKIEYRLRLSNKIKEFYTAMDLSEMGRRSMIVSFCHRVLNKRQGFEPLVFHDFTADDFDRSLKDNAYVLSIYN